MGAWRQGGERQGLELGMPRSTKPMSTRRNLERRYRGAVACGPLLLVPVADPGVVDEALVRAYREAVAAAGRAA